MTSVCWKSAVTWSLLVLMFLLFALMYGAVPALAHEPDAVLYEVTEDMYLKDSAGKFVNSVVPGGRRTAVAQLSGWAKVGTPLCPAWVRVIAPKTKKCTLNATGADDLSLETGKGTLAGSYSVVVQGDNKVDAPEFVVMSGTFKGDADLSPSMSGQAPLGYITNGVATVDGPDGKPAASFKFTGTFRLPFALDEGGRYRNYRPWFSELEAYYLDNSGNPKPVKDSERSLGRPTVRIEIDF
jgi:hypothetical protein